MACLDIAGREACLSPAWPQLNSRVHQQHLCTFLGGQSDSDPVQAGTIRSVGALGGAACLAEMQTARRHEIDLKRAGWSSGMDVAPKHEH